MIKIENAVINGWEAAIRGMRNPLESWDKSDSFVCDNWMNAESCHRNKDCIVVKPFEGDIYCIGDNDFALMKRLANAGADHGKFMRFITVTADIVAPRYWWIEFDTYKVGTVSNSCSTMHKIHSKEFTIDDFSHEHIHDAHGTQLLLDLIEHLNEHRKWFNVETDATLKKQHWWEIIQMLPQSYNQRRTVFLNYQVLKTMYHARKNHKLDCWIHFCKWVETLPYAKELICDVG